MPASGAGRCRAGCARAAPQGQGAGAEGEGECRRAREARRHRGGAYRCAATPPLVPLFLPPFRAAGSRCAKSLTGHGNLDLLYGREKEETERGKKTEMAGGGGKEEARGAHAGSTRSEGTK